MKKTLISTQPFLIKEASNLSGFSRRKKLNESIDKNGGRLIVSGVLQRANTRNQNQRIYPREILEREVNKYLQTEIAEKRAYGELDHPESSVVNLKNVSHVVRECWWDGDDVVGKVEILNTPSGNILKELILADLTVGISSRGMGSVKKINEDTDQVEDDFQLVCWDFVSNPSTHGAFLTVNESVNNSKQNIYEEAELIIRDIICELSGNCCLYLKGKGK
jgi:hypothetical protein